MNLRITLIGLAIFLSACDLSLASDLTPPPDALVSNQAAPNPIAAPASDPDLLNGAGLYTQNCAPCHGAGGLGDGEQDAQLPFAPAPLGDADFALAASPANWFRWVSEGRLTRFMPPFASLLSEQERWDVLAYVYGLSWDEDELRRGAELYTQTQNEADGLLSGEPLSVQLSLLQPLGLSDEDTSALTAYLQARALGVKVSDLQQVAVSQEPAENIDLPEVGSFTGKVIHAGEDALPAGLEATLSGYDHAEQVFTTTVELDADGELVFEDIPLAAQRIYFVQVAYQGQIYFSEFINPSGSNSEFQLPITVYETTTSTEQLTVETVQLFFDYSKADIVRVAQQVTISNLGDRAVVPQADGTPVLHFSLPDSAANLAFEEGALGERYLQEETGFGELRGVLPGANSYRMLFAYELPYTNSLEFSLGIDLPTRTVLALVPENQIKLNSTGFQLTTSQLVDGETYTAYVASDGYLPGDEVPIALSGAHPAAHLVWDALLRDDNLLLGLAALTAAVGFAWLWVRSLPAPNPEQLLEEIAVLDERYAADRISKASYAKRRATLKSQLRAALAKRAKR